MSALIHLVRHGPHDDVTRILSGRCDGSPLNGEGRDQAKRIGEALGGAGVGAVETSPRLRARQTAEIIARSLGVQIRITDALDEIDFGEWTGRSFDDLDRDARWHGWNRARARSCPPGGESMAAAVKRTVAHLDAVAAGAGGAGVLCVSHCDVIRGAIGHYLGLGLDDLLRFDVDPGSISTLMVGAWGGRLTSLNRACG